MTKAVAMVPRGCARRAGWVPLVMVAVWVAVLLAGCSSRLPPYAESALRVTVTEARRDIDGKGPVRDGYRRTVAVLCAVLERDAVEGRGWVEYVAGLAGVTEHDDAAVPEACRD